MSTLTVVRECITESADEEVCDLGSRGEVGGLVRVSVDHGEAVERPSLTARPGGVVEETAAVASEELLACMMIPFAFTFSQRLILEIGR